MYSTRGVVSVDDYDILTSSCSEDSGTREWLTMAHAQQNMFLLTCNSSCFSLSFLLNLSLCKSARLDLFCPVQSLFRSLSLDITRTYVYTSNYTLDED